MRELANLQTNILKEQFIPDHVFLYITKGALRFFDGNKSQIFTAGECGIARKNSFAKFELLDSEEEFQPIVFCFDAPFLQAFQLKHQIVTSVVKNTDRIIKIRKTGLMNKFIRSLQPYYKGLMQLDEAFEDLKYEELLIILLKNNPELSGLLFEFGMPEKINLEAFMNCNYTFNVNLQRFAFLTGRSLSAFKRDFKEIFNETPGNWLVKKRLTEAYYHLAENKRRPSEIYMELGFESLSHFSVAFKKQFGCTPSELIRQNT
ncbi:helix-turn-helix domain-containing protein [Pedobacter sp. AW31-3R]|uniref:helix-turn-helix domain-containing protein n=1 Tax=Pedobacter sp. AW31-3R TaxID=3445781 RepID=UPI003FA16DE1